MEYKATLFPDEGPLRRELYPKHMAFIRAGKKYRERLCLMGNRCGKSLLGGYELTCHLTGLYPAWWEGRVFDHPVRCWAAGDTSITARDIIQNHLMGPPGEWGTGLIPKKLIERHTAKRNIPDGLQDIYIRHVSGGQSVLGIRSYDQGRIAFQGTNQHVIWLDEEPPMDVYSECLIRTMTTNGMLMATFTPLLGLSDVVMYFLPDGKIPENDFDAETTS